MADLYGYDDQWRVTTVARYEPEAFSAQTPERTFIRERFIYHASGDGFGMGVGPSGRDTPLARFLDANGDGDYADADDRIDYFLANRRGDVVAIVGPGTDTNNDHIADTPGELVARVRYSAFGTPTLVHPLDINGDGLVGGANSSAAYQDDHAALMESLANANTSRAWANLSNVAQVSCFTTPCTDDWDAWSQQQQLYFTTNYPTAAIDLRAELGNLPLLAGYWWDSKLQLYHIRHRAYDPLAGRFLQRDPIGYAGGINLYAYVGNQPGMYTDPMGLFLEGLGNSIAQAGYSGLGQAVGAVGTFVEAIVDRSVAQLNAVAHPIATGQAIYDRGRAAAENIAAARGEAASTSEVVFSVAGEVTGVNNLAASITGYDARENRELSPAERWAMGLETGGSIALSMLLPILAAESEVATVGGRIAGELEATEESTVARLQEHANAARAEVDAMGDAALTPNQRSALPDNPNLRAPFRGSAIEKAWRRLIKDDSKLRHLEPGAVNRGPDMKDLGAGKWYDLTTPGQVDKHIRKYGPNGTCITY